MIFATEPSYFFDQTVLDDYTLWRVPDIYRRRERRLLRRLESHFQVHIPELNKSLSGINISLAGLLCECEHGLLSTEKFDLELVLPRMSKNICLTGGVIEEVTYNGRPALRIRFHGLGWRSLETLSRWMLSRLN